MRPAVMPYRISEGGGPRRVIALCTVLLMNLGALWALDHGLRLRDETVQDETTIVPVPEKLQPQEPQEIPEFDVDIQPTDLTVTAPEFPIPQTSDSAITALPIPDTPAEFRTINRLPLYPESSIANCEQGKVLLALRIGADGRVVEAKIAASSGFPNLDEAALRAAEDWRYRPARINGMAVETIITQPVAFDLRNEVGLSMSERELRECLARG